MDKNNQSTHNILPQFMIRKQVLMTYDINFIHMSLTLAFFDIS